MYTVHFEKCKRLYQSNGFHEKIIFKSMFTPTHTQVHKHTHTHTTKEQENNSKRKDYITEVRSRHLRMPA